MVFSRAHRQWAVRLFCLGLLLVLAVLAGQAQTPPVGLKPTVILISFDGWRWDYQNRYPAPNLQRLIARGVRAEGLIPSFPSKTFPNHYTIVTGLYPEHHGIIANNISDPATGRRMTMSNRVEATDPMWWGGEPLWITAQRAGQVAAAMFWPGSETVGRQPRYWEPFDDSRPGNARVDRVLGWLDLPPRDRPTFITLYFSDVDSAGHSSGPDSNAVRQAVARVDRYLGRLMRGLEQRGIADRVNVVVISDHGMVETSANRVVVLDDYISLNDVDVVDINPTLALAPKPGREDAVYAALVKAHPRLHVYRRAETPPHWHYRAHPRIPAIVGVVDEGWQVLRRSTLAADLARKLIGPTGTHGYDPQVARMRGIFIAAGPAFKRGTTVPAFENVHLYEMLARVLGVTPAPNDGNPAVAQLLLAR
jgi:predicted AlkP superfamily pyrophosphatase or phosphodiesterase